jgi:hypothetical protein
MGVIGMLIIQSIIIHHLSLILSFFIFRHKGRNGTKYKGIITNVKYFPKVPIVRTTAFHGHQALSRVKAEIQFESARQFCEFAMEEWSYDGWLAY